MIDTGNSLNDMSFFLDMGSIFMVMHVVYLGLTFTRIRNTRLENENTNDHIKIPLRKKPSTGCMLLKLI